MSKIESIEREVNIHLEKYLNDVIELNDYMARNPEVSSQEYNSSKKIVELLRKNGLEVEYPYCGLDTAFKSTIYGKTKNGPRIGILVEYDALPEIGHGCGHCASGSISILAGLIINSLKDKFDAQVDIIGTPDEEIMGGKIVMAKKGVFEKYDYAIMIHMNNSNATYSELLALDGIKVEFVGLASHAAAAPWEGKNALNSVQLFFHSLDMMRQHVKSDIKIHGIIKEGGNAANIVPDFASAEVYTRGKDRNYLDEVSEWVKDCARAAAMATRTEVKISALCPSLKDLTPNYYAEKALKEIFEYYGLKIHDNVESLGSSDIGEVDYICPTFHPFVCVKEGITLHTKEFANEMTTENGHNAITNGAKILSSFIIMTLMDDELLKNIKEEYRKYRN